MKRYILLGIIVIQSALLLGQSDSTTFKRLPVDTSALKMNLDAIYNRPFLQMKKAPVALGGYLEANSSYFVTNGITEGLSFQLPRLTVFISSTINKRIKFLSEVEFEEGGKEINIELDVEAVLATEAAPA